MCICLPITIVVINHNTRSDLCRCLNSIDRSEISEVIVVDNNSCDGSVEMVRSQYPWVNVIESANCGYGAAANLAIGRCCTDFILLVNSDVIFLPGCAQSLAASLQEQERVAIVGPRILNEDGSLQRSCFPFPTPLQLSIQIFSIVALAVRFRFIRSRVSADFPHDRPQSVPWLLGAALAIRKQAFDSVGGFDPSFFLYSEEVDLCLRLRQTGWDIFFDPSGSLVHIGRTSTKQYAEEMMALRYASTHRFYRLHYSGWRMLGLRILVTYSMIRNIVLDSVRALRDVPRGTHGFRMRRLATWRRILRYYWSRSFNAPI
jgi:N-acetylglucosaminyl-diphospho-decaprenol L-rhamnosyltransferase